MAKQPILTFHMNKKSLSFDHPSSTQISGFIRDAIISMELLPGQMISETSLANQFGVSRTPVREALIQLASIGFVEVLPQRGTYVTRFSMAKILESRFIREVLEVSVVSYLAENFTENIVTDSEKIIAEQKIAAADNDPLAFQKLDDKFHQTLANHTQYPRVAQLIETEKAHMDRVRGLSFQDEHQFNLVLAQHAAIVKAIKSGSAANASKAMSIHLKDVFNVLKVIPQQHPEYFI